MRGQRFHKTKAKTGSALVRWLSLLCHVVNELLTKATKPSLTLLVDLWRQEAAATTSLMAAAPLAPGIGGPNTGIPTGGVLESSGDVVPADASPRASPKAGRAKLSRVSKNMRPLLQQFFGVQLSRLTLLPQSPFSRASRVRIEKHAINDPVATMTRQISRETLHSTCTFSSYSTAPEKGFDWCYIDGKTARVAGDRESGIAFFEPADFFGVNGIDIIGNLPPELLFTVATYLDLRSVVLSMQTCRWWHKLLDESAMWKRAYANRWLIPDIPHPVDWKAVYQARLQIEHNWDRGRIVPHSLEGHRDSVYCVKLYRDTLFTGSRDYTIKIWDLEKLTLLKTLTGHSGSVLCLAIDESIIVTGSSDCTCIVWNRHTYENICRISFHSMGVLDVVLSADYIVTGSKDQRIAVWDRRTFSFVRSISKAHEGSVNSMDLFENQLITAGGDGVVKQWDLDTGLCVQVYAGHTRGLACVKVDHGERRVYAGGNDRTIRVWSIDSGESVMVLEGHQHLVRSLFILPTRIISASYDQTVKVWDKFSGRLLSDFQGWHGSWVLCIVADARRIVSSSVGIKPVILDFTSDVDPQLRGFLSR